MFPLDGPYSSANLYFSAWYNANVVYSNKNETIEKNLTATGDTKKLKTRINDKEECEMFDIENYSAIEHVIEAFFEYTGGYVDALSVQFQLSQLPAGETEEDVVDRISKLLANRPIKVKLLSQSVISTADLNSPLNLFFRNHIDFEMYATEHTIDMNLAPLVISPKMVSCKFLYFDVKLVNSEVLEDFKGWGLVFRKEDPRYNFEYLKEFFHKWYSGEERNLRYLCVACDVTLDSCDPLFSLGKKIEIQRFDHGPVTEYEIKRHDGEICRLGGSILNTRVKVSDQEPKLFYLYLGECTDDIFLFHSWRNLLR